MTGSNRIELAVMQCSGVSVGDATTYKQWLSNDELERNTRYRFARDRHRDVLARSLVRNVLAARLDTDPQAIEFELGDHGKPAIAGQNRSSSYFNLSHAEDWIVLAVSSRPVGVDIEYTRRSNDVVAIADRFFFGDEYRQLMTFDEVLRPERFFDYWTLKEAYMKARGEGISLGLSNFGFDLSSGIRLQLTSEVEDSPDDWWFHCSTPVQDYRLALALKTGGQRPDISLTQYRTAEETCDCVWLMEQD